MIQFILKRLGYGILVMVGVVTVVFTLFNILPVDPARLTLGQRADVESVEAINKELGLDKPMPVQFAMYLNDISPIAIHENNLEAKEKYKYLKLIPFGKQALVLKAPYLRRSYQTKRPVSEVLGEAMPQTIILAVASMLIATFLGILFGIIAAIRQHSWLDSFLMAFSQLGISIPSYLSAILLSHFFGNVLADITGLNQTGGLFEMDDFGNRFLSIKNLILPTIALGTRPIGIIFQLTRTSMLEVLNQDYIRTAKAKGLAFGKILYKHALRNALNPVVTTVSGWFAALLAGAFFVEYQFGIRGLGLEAVDSLLKFDFPITMGAVLYTAFIFVIINILVDILYAVLDPRISVK